MNAIKTAFIKTVIFPVARYFWAWGEKIDEMAAKTSINNIEQLAKFEIEYARFQKEFDALPPMIREMVGATRKSWIQ